MADGTSVNRIYEHLNYRDYLKAAFGRLREQSPHFSYRNFNRRAGFRSSGFMKMVIDGKRNLTWESASKIARALKLPDDETRFFVNLVAMNQADNHEEKDRHFRELTRNRSFREIKPLTAIQYNLFSHWYYAVLLEMVRLEGSNGDLEWYSSRLNPPVPSGEVRRALQELEKAGLIRRDPSGRFVRTEEMIRTPDTAEGIALVNFHREMSERAREAVGIYPAAEREFSSLTIALSLGNFERLKGLIQSFRRKVHREIEVDNKKRELVVQLNLQLFPLTKKGEIL